MCLTLPFKSFDDNMVLKIVNWIRDKCQEVVILTKIYSTFVTCFASY